VQQSFRRAGRRSRWEKAATTLETKNRNDKEEAAEEGTIATDSGRNGGSAYYYYEENRSYQNVLR